MNDEKRDTFPDLIADMRGEEPDMPPEYHAYASEQLNAYADRLEALLAAMDPFLMPVYGQVLAGGAIETDPPPILADMLGDEPAPGSDLSDEEFERNEAEIKALLGDDPVTGDG